MSKKKILKRIERLIGKDSNYAFIMAAAWYILCNPEAKGDIKRLKEAIKEINDGELKLTKFITIKEFLK